MFLRREFWTDFVTAGMWPPGHDRDTDSGGNKWLNKTLP